MAKIILALIFLTLGAYAKYPYWLRYGVKIVAEFETLNKSNPYYVEGYGLVINENLILTSASNVYNATRARDIVLYHTEVLGEPIECLSHAKILALDDSLDLAVLETEKFTDIYCNVLPEPNFRALSFGETYFNLFSIPPNLPLRDDLEISFFKEHDWSQLIRERKTLKEFLEFEKSADKSQLSKGMPLFAENAFLGLRIYPIPNAKSESLKLGILTHSEILTFLCKIQSETSVLANKKELATFCKSWADLQK